MVSRHDIDSKDENAIRSHGHKIIKKLGKGTYATVYLTEFLEDSNKEKSKLNQFACKIMDTQKSPEDFVKKFLPRELKALRELRHPHIIHIHSIFKNDNKYLIFMRYAERGDLLEFTIKYGAIRESQARMWAKQISLALEYLHELQMAHRDLKCENILITNNFNAKVADFGFSRFLLDDNGNKVLSETYCGSTSYSPPEILKGIPYNPKASDIWSLGIIIYVMLNKAMPFGDMSVKKLYEEQVKKKWKFKSYISTIISAQVKDLLNNMLEPDPAKRFTVEKVLNSEWIRMDPRIQGMSEEENLALKEAKEKRQKLERKKCHLLKNKNPVEAK
ncbi:cAMP-dependent protein kinase catalytic subunit, putative [Pediculus humanus corporis]|uniref:cAMP-dependent protein kinase catalytic subunit, putative n=1 Tax=Pediculus humanus subsp. corporis TaxID=121224 RepID=E0VUJ7_PEDHC|nr:cAMP-dependent protein kinase catalytic subunit, putative [Pediculus humanus corporis]EEB17053.1 cAMP-dependent protein kinase catalytic subunit, putative [Pediculus humanus corporis]